MSDTDATLIDAIARRAARLVADELRSELRAAVAEAISGIAPGQGAKDYVRAREAAELLGVAVGTLEDWRARGDGPEFRRHGRIVIYRRADLAAWSAAQKVGAAPVARSKKTRGR